MRTKNGRAGDVKPERASELRLQRAGNKKRKREERREGEKGDEKVAGAPPAPFSTLRPQTQPPSRLNHRHLVRQQRKLKDNT
jgi:hypothetical protein